MSRYRENATRAAEILLAMAMAGPDAWALLGRHLPQSHDDRHVGEFVVTAGESVDFELSWFPSHREVPPALDADAALDEAVQYLTRWGGHCRQDGVYGGAVKRSLLVLRALTHYETGGIVHATGTTATAGFVTRP